MNRPKNGINLKLLENLNVPIYLEYVFLLYQLNDGNRIKCRKMELVADTTRINNISHYGEPYHEFHVT